MTTVPEYGVGPRPGSATAVRWAPVGALSVIVLVLLAGGLCLAMPFMSDQALFTVYAREIADGAVLYRDLFDIKQPGIYAFYTIGGLLFGFNEIGIHLAELLYWLIFSVFAVVALRRHFTTAWGALLVPVFTVVAYYLCAGTRDLTQIEILVAFPVLVAWWLLDQADPSLPSGLGRYALAGLTTSGVVLLKHLYLLIPLAFLVSTVRRCSKQGASSRDLRRALALFSIGLVVPLVIVVTYFAAYGQLERVRWIYFQFVPGSQLLGTKSLADLRSGARSFAIGHAPILILAVVGCISGLDRHGRAQTLVGGMILWIVTGAVALSIQAYWDYKWLLFSIPVGILAAVGFERLPAWQTRARLRERRWTLVAAGGVALAVWLVAVDVPRLQTILLTPVLTGAASAIAVALLSDHERLRRRLGQVLLASLAIATGIMAISPANKVRALAAHRFALTVTDGAEFRRAINPPYSSADAALATFRRIQTLPGPIHIFGDPVLLFRSGRRPAIAFLGQDPHSWDERAWMEMERDLRATTPPYIVMDAYHESFIRHRSPGIIGWIASNYRVAFASSSGIWYERR